MTLRNRRAALAAGPAKARFGVAVLVLGTTGLLAWSVFKAAGIVTSIGQARAVASALSPAGEDKFAKLMLKLRSEHEVPRAPKELGDDLVVLVGAVPRSPVSISFSGYKESFEIWLYMPQWGIAKDDRYYVECFGRYLSVPPTLDLQKNRSELSGAPFLSAPFYWKYLQPTTFSEGPVLPLGSLRFLHSQSLMRCFQGDVRPILIYAAKGGPASGQITAVYSDKQHNLAFAARASAGRRPT